MRSEGLEALREREEEVSEQGKFKWNRSLGNTVGYGLKLIAPEDYKKSVRKFVYDPSFGMSREYVWVDDAACGGVDPEIFQMGMPDDPGFEGLNFMQTRKINLERLAKAREYCDTCPVRLKCVEEAEPGDLYWSVRGGLEPKRLTRGARAPIYDITPWVEAICKHHGVQYMRNRVGFKTNAYCSMCESDSEE